VTDEFSERAQIALQLDMARRVFATRLVTSMIGYLLMAVYLPVWLCLLCYLIDMGSEKLAQGLMEGLDPTRDKGRLWLTGVCVVVAKLVFCLPAVVIWNSPQDLAQAAAVGLVCTTMFQLAATRAIYLPLGLLGLATITLTCLIGNAVYWVDMHNPAAMAISTAGIFGATFYSLTAMRAINGMQREINQRSAEANAANRAKGQFLAQISHELRTPLNAIIGMGSEELYTNERGDTARAATRARMQVLVESARGLAATLDDILDISALDANKLTIRPQPVALREAIAACAALYASQFRAAGLQLQLQLAEDLPDQAVLDPQRLRQCLSNLLSNALKFTQSGEVRISAAMQGQMLQIEVRDSGRGIAPEELALLFTPFERGNSMASGTGLGLAISRGLARQMGGDLTALPAEQGALFRLTLHASPVTGSAAPEPVAPLDLDQVVVLIVDDIATNRLVAATYLRRLGAQTCEAASGPEALRILQGTSVDLVLLDLAMPKMTGLECLASIRQSAPPDLPVIAMTADASLAERQSYARAGLDGFVVKPLTLEALQEALRPHLPAAQDSLATPPPLAERGQADQLGL
jgi:two-component system, sensor histidine kinase